MRVRPTIFPIALAALVFSVFAYTAPSQSVAQQSVMIRLESPDGTVKLQGRLQQIEDGFYVLETAAGNTIKADAARINCVSVICPDYSFESQLSASAQ